MNIKRAILLSIVAYAASFVLAVLVGMVLNTGVSSDVVSVPTHVWLVGMSISVLVMLFATRWYFKAGETTPSAAHGAYFGGIAIATGFTLDIVTVLPFGNPVAVLGQYYAQPFFVGTLALILITTTYVGYRLEHARR